LFVARDRNKDFVLESGVKGICRDRRWYYDLVKDVEKGPAG